MQTPHHGQWQDQDVKIDEYGRSGRGKIPSVKVQASAGRHRGLVPGELDGSAFEYNGQSSVYQPRRIKGVAYYYGDPELATGGEYALVEAKCRILRQTDTDNIGEVADVQQLQAILYLRKADGFFVLA